MNYYIIEIITINKTFKFKTTTKRNLKKHSKWLEKHIIKGKGISLLMLNSFIQRDNHCIFIPSSAIQKIEVRYYFENEN